MSAYRHDGGASGATIICEDCHAARPDTVEEAEAQGLDACEVMEWDATSYAHATTCDICDRTITGSACPDCLGRYGERCGCDQ